MVSGTHMDQGGPCGSAGRVASLWVGLEVVVYAFQR